MKHSQQPRGFGGFGPVALMAAIGAARRTVGLAKTNSVMTAVAASLAPLRHGTWLDRQRLRLAAAVLLAVELAVFAWLVAGTHGWIVPLATPTTTDFVSFYAAESLADGGAPALAYDRAAHLAAEEQVTGPGIRYQYFNYPPVFLLLCAPLAHLPYMAAFLLFEGASLGLYLFVACRIIGDRSWTALLALAAFPIVWWNLGLGQNAFLTAALFGAATLAIDRRRPIAAGLLFGALCYKPQFGLLVPLALAAAGGRYWRTIAAAAGSASMLALASLALFGAGAWLDFFHTVAASPAMYQSGRILFAGMANPFGAARLLGAGLPFAYAAQAAASLAAAAVVVVVWRRRRLSLPTRAAVLAAASLVAAPLALLYDLMLGAIAAAWLIRDRASPAAAGWEATVLAALYPLLLAGRGLAGSLRIPVFPLAALALFAMAAARAWREAHPAEADWRGQDDRCQSLANSSSCCASRSDTAQNVIPFQSQCTML
jgi:alpha-1,2-mannosyltransferase